MAKQIKDEIEKYFNKNVESNKKININKIEQEILKRLPEKINKGVREINIKNKILYIKTKTPSWRQEIQFLKKEIMKIIDKKSSNYGIEKIIIL